MKDSQRRALVIRGGSSKGLAYCGALRAWSAADAPRSELAADQPARRERPVLREIDCAIGSSAGALVVFVLALARARAFSMPKSYEELLGEELAELACPNTNLEILDLSPGIAGYLSPFPILRLLRKGRFATGDGLTRYIESRIQNLLRGQNDQLAAQNAKKFTWQALAEQAGMNIGATYSLAGTGLVVVVGTGAVVDKAAQERAEKSRRTLVGEEPTVAQVIQASAALPFVFPPVGEAIDGGVLENLPVSAAKKLPTSHRRSKAVGDELGFEPGSHRRWQRRSRHATCR